MKVLFLIAPILMLAKNLECNQFFYTPNSHRLNFFDVELLRYSVEDKKGNVMVSPASIRSTLLMILEGAAGTTALEIQNALRLSSDRYEMKDQLQKFLKALQVNTTVECANGIFVSRKLKLKQEYENIVKREYSSEITRLDFNDPNAAALAINGWVSQKTRGLIPFIVEPVHVVPTTEFLIANALYFKSTWRHAFDPRLTRSGCFHKEGQCINAAMMDLSTELQYAFVNDLKAHALELPYEGNRYSMLLLVPVDKNGCENLVRDLPFVGLHQIYDMMRPTDVQLLMPKFTVNYNVDLVNVLSNMRISSLFSSKANISGILEGETTNVNNFQHKVFMSVDETGTIASAATSAMIVPLMYNGVDVRADRPFVFYIMDNTLGVILFEGKIEEPSPYAEPMPRPVPVYPAQVQSRSPYLNQEPLPAYTNTNKKSGGFVDSLKKIFG